MGSFPRFHLNVAYCLGIALVAGCGPGEDDGRDRDPPRVVGVSPSSSVIRVSDAFTIQFSEPLSASSVNTDTVVLVESALVSDAFLSDIANAPLSDSRRDDIVVAEVVLESGGDVVSLTPSVNLRAGTPYTLLVSEDVRDNAGNPLVGVSGLAETFRLDVRTDDGPPRLVSDDVGDTVPPNRKRFTLRFDQPMLGLSRETITLAGVDAIGQTLVPEIEAIEISPERDQATLIIAEAATCFRFAGGGSYEIRLGAGITDDEGEAFEPETLPFLVATECDLSANRVLEPPEGIGGETTATLTWYTSKASTTKARFGRAELDCLGGVPCPVFGEAATSADGQGRFRHTVVVTGLAVNETYAFSVSSEDRVGSVAVAEGSFTTAPFATLAVTEILADGASPAGSDIADADGEFVELQNFGAAESIPLAGYALRIDDTDCPLPADMTLAPGAFVVLAHDSFSAQLYPGVDLDRVVPVLCRSLTNSTVQSFAVIDPEGRPISTMGGYSSLDPQEGRSVERVEVEGPDVETNWCYSRSDVGPTPGATNGVTLQGCE